MIWALLACVSEEVRYIGGGELSVQLSADSPDGLEGSLSFPGLEATQTQDFWERWPDLGPQEVCAMDLMGAGLREQITTREGLTNPGVIQHSLAIHGCAPATDLLPAECVGPEPLTFSLTLVREPGDDGRVTPEAVAKLDLTVRDDQGEYALKSHTELQVDMGEVGGAGAGSLELPIVAEMTPFAGGECAGSSTVLVEWEFDVEEGVVEAE